MSNNTEFFSTIVLKIINFNILTIYPFKTLEVGNQLEIYKSSSLMPLVPKM